MLLLPTLKHEINRQYSSLFEDVANRLITVSSAANKQFKANLKQNEGGYELTAELPGFTKSEIDVSIVENRIVVSATKESHVEEVNTWLLFEHNTNYVTRTFTLPEFVDRDKTEAMYENGILTVKLVTTETRPNSHIAIK